MTLYRIKNLHFKSFFRTTSEILTPKDDILKTHAEKLIVLKCASQSLIMFLTLLTLLSFYQTYILMNGIHPQ